MIIITVYLCLYLYSDRYTYMLGPFLASFMVSSSGVCRTKWKLYKMPLGLSGTILLSEKNLSKTLRNYMRNTKTHNKTLVELFAKSNEIPWNYMKKHT